MASVRDPGRGDDPQRHATANRPQRRATLVSVTRDRPSAPVTGRQLPKGADDLRRQWRPTRFGVRVTGPRAICCARTANSPVDLARPQAFAAVDVTAPDRIPFVSRALFYGA